MYREAADSAALRREEESGSFFLNFDDLYFGERPKF